jgi:predicted ATPase
VLATSREALRVDGERLMVVGPLEPGSGGVELFDARVATTDPDTSTDRNGVEEICRRLDGVPLAIELVAARVQGLGIRRLLAELDEHLRARSGGRRVGVERDRTLRATVGWAYEQLDPSDRELFRGLSIFAGWFDAAAAEAVIGRTPVGAAVDVAPSSSGSVGRELDLRLRALADRSMLVAGHGAGGERFRMPTTLRDFAAETLSRHGATEGMAERHASWCVVRAVEIGRQLGGPDSVEAADRLADLWPELRAALEWACGSGDPGRAVRLVRPVVTELVLRDRPEIRTWIERILDRASAAADRRRPSPGR